MVIKDSLGEFEVEVNVGDSEIRISRGHDQYEREYINIPMDQWASIADKVNDMVQLAKKRDW